MDWSVLPLSSPCLHKHSYCTVRLLFFFQNLEQRLVISLKVSTANPSAIIMQSLRLHCFRWYLCWWVNCTPLFAAFRSVSATAAHLILQLEDMWPLSLTFRERDIWHTAWCQKYRLAIIGIMLENICLNSFWCHCTTAKLSNVSVLNWAADMFTLFCTRIKAIQTKAPSTDCGVCTLTFPLENQQQFFHQTVIIIIIKKHLLSLTVD